MNENQENIDRLFQDRLFNYTVNPPEIVWKKIEEDLHQEKKKNLFPVYIRIAAVLILFAGLGGVVWKLMNNSSRQITNPTTATYNVITPSIKENNITNNGKKSTLNNLIAKDNTGSIRKSAPPKTQMRKISDNHEQIHEMGSVVNNDTSNISQYQLLSSADSLFPVTLIRNEVGNECDSAKQITNILTSNKTETDSSAHSMKACEPAKSLPVSILDVFLAEDAPKNAKSPKWLIGGQAGPQYSYRDISSDKATTARYNNIESPIMAYAGGVNIQLEATRRWSVQSGVYYSKIGTERSLDNVQDTKLTGAVQNEGNPNQFVSQGNTSDVYMNTSGTITFTYKRIDATGTKALQGSTSTSTNDYRAEQYCEYIEVPLILRYRLLTNKLKVNLLGGISSNILVGNSVHETGPDNFNVTAHIEGVNKTNFNGSVGFGIEYPLSGKILFNLEPVFKYYLSPVSENQDVEVHPYSIGLMTGISCKF